jgi:hypothetical protein
MKMAKRAYTQSEREQRMGCKVMGWDPELNPWEESVDGAALLDEISETIKRHVVLPEWSAEALALWVLHTYAFELREITAYVGVESPEKRCGKTTLLGTMAELVNRPVVSANISSPAFFRVIEELRPTLLLDEADTTLVKNDELRGILNAGSSRKTAFVVRMASISKSEDQGMPNEAEMPEESGGDGLKLVRYSCWCPKMLAAIGRLPETIEDRSIVVKMHRKTIQETCARLKVLESTRLRRQCLRFVQDHQKEIAESQPTAPRELNDRAADVWEPLLALADLAGGDWPTKARGAAVALTERAQENSPIGSLLLDILLVFTTAGQSKLFSRTIISGLSRFRERPWHELRGKWIDELWLSRRLNPYGVRPRTLRIGEERAKGYMLEDLMDACRRYIPDSEVKRLRAEGNLVEDGKEEVVEPTIGRIGNDNAQQE